MALESKSVTASQVSDNSKSRNSLLSQNDLDILFSFITRKSTSSVQRMGTGKSQNLRGTNSPLSMQTYSEKFISDEHKFGEQFDRIVVQNVDGDYDLDYRIKELSVTHKDLQANYNWSL